MEENLQEEFVPAADISTMNLQMLGNMLTQANYYRYLVSSGKFHAFTEYWAILETIYSTLRPLMKKEDDRNAWDSSRDKFNREIIMIQVTRRGIDSNLIFQLLRFHDKINSLIHEFGFGFQEKEENQIEASP